MEATKTQEPTLEKVEEFVDLIQYNQSQRNFNRDFLMTQFRSGNISFGTIKNVLIITFEDELRGIDTSSSLEKTKLMTKISVALQKEGFEMSNEYLYKK